MYNSDEFLNIDTPENVAFGYEVAGIGSRFIAALVDTIFIIILQIIVNVAVAFLGRLIFDLLDIPLDSATIDTILAWLLAGFGLLAFVLFWGYYIGFELFWNGQSPGKWMMGLRVLRTDGSPISLAEALIRNLVRLVDFMPAFYGVGVVTMFINAQARRMGDLAANTLVVYDQDAITL
ncbi:MAG: RDD family protein, partial [Okeania sp. SIO3B3]|nr:RDD family protein [Okeania sp. SIO3B3]